MLCWSQFTIKYYCLNIRRHISNTPKSFCYWFLGFYIDKGTICNINYCNYVNKDKLLSLNVHIVLDFKKLLLFHHNVCYALHETSMLLSIKLNYNAIQVMMF